MKRLEKLSRILEYLDHLNALEIRNRGDLEKLEKYYATSQILFNIINEMIDIGEEICIEKGYYPNSYREIFEILKNLKMIDETLFREIKNLIKIRNIIAHRYSRLSKEDLFEISQKIKEIVERFLKSLFPKGL